MHRGAERTRTSSKIMHCFRILGRSYKVIRSCRVAKFRAVLTARHQGAEKNATRPNKDNTVRNFDDCCCEQQVIKETRRQPAGMRRRNLAEERAAHHRDVRSRTSTRFKAGGRRNPARLMAAGGRQGGTEWVGVRLGELGARGAAVRASKPPMFVQAGAEPHFAL